MINLPAQQPDKLDHFVSQPGLLAPQITVLKQGGTTSGDIFLTPLPSPIVHPESNNAISINPVGPGGPMILDSRGRLVWFAPAAADRWWRPTSARSVSPATRC